MRLLAALMVGSGAAWVAGILVANPYLLVPALPPVFIIAVCYLVVAAGVVLATQRHSQLPGRLIALWALAIIALGVSLAPAGPGRVSLRHHRVRAVDRAAVAGVQLPIDLQAHAGTGLTIDTSTAARLRASSARAQRASSMRFGIAPQSRRRFPGNASAPPTMLPSTRAR